MKLSEFKGEDALDVLADIIEPATAILNDEAIRKAWGSGSNVAACIKIALKEHKKEILTIMAVLEQKPYDEFVETVNVLTLPVQLMQIMQDKELMSFFTGLQVTTAEESSGDVTEATNEEA